ncbi:hypothetical protein LIT32_18015 [Bacillus sp. CMF21]|nr:hypothetical protein LIT32_18015 [Bacillus sp. CMF21]
MADNLLDKLKEGLNAPIVKPEAYQFDDEAMGEYMIKRNQPLFTHLYAYKVKKRDKDTNNTIEVNENPAE